MNTGNALGFLGFGLGMGVLAWAAPAGLCPVGPDGLSGRALWLGLMGTLQGGIGAGHLIRHALWPVIAGWLAPQPAAAPGREALPSPLPVPQELAPVVAFAPASEVHADAA